MLHFSMHISLHFITSHCISDQVHYSYWSQMQQMGRIFKTKFLTTFSQITIKLTHSYTLCHISPNMKAIKN
jgi:hypothetical protein